SCKKRLEQHSPYWSILQTSTGICVFGFRVYLHFRKFFLEAQDLDHSRISDEIECWIPFMKFNVTLFHRYRGKWIHKASVVPQFRLCWTRASFKRRAHDRSP